MSREDAIEVEGSVVEVLPNSLLWVELPNRHRLLARLASRARQGLVPLVSGDWVRVQVSPCDLSKGRIIDRSIELRNESPRLS